MQQPFIIEDSILALMDSYAKKIAADNSIDLKIEANTAIDKMLMAQILPDQHRWYLKQFEDYKHLYGGRR